MFEFLEYQFMVRALIAGVMISVILGWLGVFVVVRKMSFIGDGIAHASLAGIALALLFGWAPVPIAIGFSILVASSIFFIEKKTNISSDMAIAIMFTTGMAIGIVLLNFYQGYQPELLSYLFGNILAVNSSDLGNILVFGSLILLVLLIFQRNMFFVTFDPVGAYLFGIRPWIYELVLYIVTAIAIVLSIKLVGIILVSALLVTPSAISKLFARSFRSFTIITISVSISIVIVGLILSFYLDLPSGATIVLTATSILMLSFGFKNLLDKTQRFGIK